MNRLITGVAGIAALVLTQAATAQVFGVQYGTTAAGPDATDIILAPGEEATIWVFYDTGGATMNSIGLDYTVGVDGVVEVVSTTVENPDVLVGEKWNVVGLGTLNPGDGVLVGDLSAISVTSPSTNPSLTASDPTFISGSTYRL